MSRFRHAVKDRDQHIQTLRIACAVLAFFLLFTCAGWMLAPSKLTVHNPPDLRTGSTRPRWEVPPRRSTPLRSTFFSSSMPGRKTARWIIPPKSMRCRRI